MPKKFKSKLKIKVSGLKTMLLVIKFDLIANTSTPNTIKSSKPSFLNCFKFTSYRKASLQAKASQKMENL